MKLKLGKKAGKDAGAAPPPDNPYLNAQNVWLERYGNFVQQAYNWRLIAMLEAVALTVGIVGLVYTANQSKFVPYIVAIDKLGLPVDVHIAEQASNVDSRVLYSLMARWISNARSIVADRVIEKEQIDSVYSMVQSNSAAYGYLQDYYPKNDPFKGATKGTIDVNVDTILPISPQTYLVDWTESGRDIQGHSTTTQHWEASISVALSPPSDLPGILRNPIGLYITDIKWTQKS